MRDDAVIDLAVARLTFGPDALLRDREPLDGVVLDPPRAGAAERTRFRTSP